MPSLHRALLFTILATATALAQTASVPLINQPLVPASAVPGGGEFYLTVPGQGFAPDAVLNWNGSTRVTIVNSSDSLQAVINAIDIAKQGTASITVTNPAPGGGTSNVVYFPIRKPSASVAMAGGAAFAGGTVVIGDFNNDGIPDVAVVGSNPVNGELDILTYLGKGNGTFSAPSVSTAYDYPEYIFVADVNGDGKLDLLVGSSDDDGYGSTDVYFGNGDGTFTWTTGMAGAVEAVGDWNGDGKLDVVVAYYDEDLSYSAVFLGDGTGNFPTQSQYEIGYYGDSVLGQAAVGDFDGDGKLDLAFPGVGVALGNGDGTFQNPIYYSNSYFGDWVVTADINGDGKLDLITSGLAVLLGNGDGTFTSAGGVNLGNPYSNLVIGDFNGDGKLDVATWSSSYSNQAITILLGNGDATFGTPISIPLQKSYPNGFESLGLGDFNGDGKLDLVLGGATNTLLLLQNTVALTPSALAFGNQSTGTRSAPQTLTLSNLGTSPLSVGTITITGDRAFSETNTCNGSVAAGSSCSIMVVFAPTSGGSKVASISVAYQGLGSPTTASLTGTGVNAATASLSPAVLKFPTELIGAVSQAQTATLTNTGTLTISVSSIMATGAFTETNNCPATLGQGGNCQIQVQFKASARGAQLGQLTVTDTAVNSPQTARLSGTGTVVQLSATGVNFGDQKVGTSSASVPVRLTNEGSVPLSITQISITGANSTDFSQSNNCGAGIPAGATCSISLTFTPQATGVRTAAVAITDNGGASPQSVSLTGTGD
jgi:hypothetical protein